MTAISDKQTCHKSTDTIDISPVGGIIHLRFFPSFLLEIRNSLTAAALPRKWWKWWMMQGKPFSEVFEGPWNVNGIGHQFWNVNGCRQTAHKGPKKHFESCRSTSWQRVAWLEKVLSEEQFLIVYGQFEMSVVNPILTSLHVPMGGHLVVSLLRMLSCFLNVLAQQQLHQLKMPNTEYTSNISYLFLLKDLSINDSAG